MYSVNCTKPGLRFGVQTGCVETYEDVSKAIWDTLEHWNEDNCGLVFTITETGKENRVVATMVKPHDFQELAIVIYDGGEMEKFVVIYRTVDGKTKADIKRV